MNDKSVLVINTPKSCTVCHFYRLLDNCEPTCQAGDRTVYLDTFNVSKEKWENCPLKPFPKKIDKIPSQMRTTHDYSLIEQMIYQKGWNDCLAEIMGETEC